MALIRCLDHPPTDDPRDWVVAVEPVGYPETTVICPYRTHEEVTPAVVFLTESEYEFYQHGRRVFSPAGSATRVHVTDTFHVYNPLTLPRPPEPSRADLDIDTDTSIEECGDGPPPPQITQRVQSYLWTDYWKDTLGPQGLTWNEFRSETAEANTALKEWIAGKRSWEDVLTRYTVALDAELES